MPIPGTQRNKINLIDNLKIFKTDFLCGEPLKNFFGKYKLKDFNVKKEKYRWWKNNKVIKIDEFIKLGEGFSYDELKELKIKSKNTPYIPVIFEVSDKFLEFCGLWIGDGSYVNYNKN